MGKHGLKDQFWTKRWRRTAIVFSLLLILGGAAFWLALSLVPLPENLFSSQPQSIELVDCQGQSLRVVQQDGSPIRQRVTYAQIPPALIQATLAAEDRRFWKHPGVDWKATLRASWQLVRSQRIISGGSTITQQLIKLAHPRPRTFRTKLIEAVSALRLEQVWDKQRILSEYINRVDYGNFNIGGSAAAQFYFAKPLKDLSPAECAFLAGLPQAPTRLNPHEHFSRAQKRQQWILHGMFLCGSLTEGEYSRARTEPLRLASPARTFQAPHFVDLVLQQVLNLPEFVVSNQIQTTLNLELNRFAANTLREQLSLLKEKNVHNGAIVIIDNKTGHVLALVGSENYFASNEGQVDGAWAARSAGSTFKPFTYLLALEKGATPATISADVPVDFPTTTGLFTPVNYDRHCYGPMRYRLALANSLNIPAVKVLASVGGPEVLLQTLRSCGLTTLTNTADHYGLGLTIGNAESRLLELANAYACLARLGTYKPWSLIVSPKTPDGKSDRSIAHPDAAYLIADILSDNNARTLAFGPQSPLRFDFPVACKTGTSSNYRDNWAFGYTPEFTVGVWVGNFNGSPMNNVSGVSGAGPILHDLFERLHTSYGTTWYAKPAKIREVFVHTITGKRIAPDSPHRGEAVLEKFIESNLPSMESASDYDSANRVLLNSEYAKWFASNDNWLNGQVALQGGGDSVHILFPPPGTIIHLDPDLPRGGSILCLEAAGMNSLQWASKTLQLRKEGTKQYALLTQGRHELTVRNPDSGATAMTWIDVIGQ